MKQIFLLLGILILTACKDAKKSEIVPNKELSQDKIIQSEKPHLGKKMLETECYICHDPKASEESMIAPPMVAIKKHYIDSNTTKEEFTEALIQWIIDPETESKMPDAFKKFGSMPYIPYSDDAMTQIAEYLYDYEIEKPAWFDAHFEEQHGKGKGKGRNTRKHEDARSGETQKDQADIGMEYALAAKGTLGKNLMKSIQQNGAVGAVAFCKIRALTLTDSISVMKNAVIKRVSDKPRNSNNAANKEELGYIAYFKKLVAAGTKPKPIVKTENGEVDFYYPITTNEMCLQCHGKPNEQIKPETLAALKNLYPADEAVGYNVDEVRGIWTINFDEN